MYGYVEVELQILVAPKERIMGVIGKICKWVLINYEHVVED